MNKKIIKYLIWTIIISAILILMPTKQTMATISDVDKDGKGYISYREFKTSPNLFCVNYGDQFHEQEYFFQSKDITEDEVLFPNNNKTVDTGILKYIISESASGKYGDRTNVSNYIPQIAIWKLSGANVGDEANSLIADAYAYNEFPIDAPAPQIVKEDDSIVIYYTEITANTGYGSGTYSNLIIDSIEVTGLTYRETETCDINGYNKKRIYVKDEGISKATIKFDYETSRNATLKLFYSQGRESTISELEFYGLANARQGTYFLKIGDSFRCYGCGANGLNEMKSLLGDDVEAVEAVKAVEAFVDSWGYIIDDTKDWLKNDILTSLAAGMKIYYCDEVEGSHGYFLCVNGDTYTLYIITRMDEVLKPNLTEKITKTPPDKKPQNLLYGEGEVLTSSISETIEFIPKVNLIINKTDSLTGTKLANARFKVELTNAESIDGYQIAQVGTGETQNPPTVVYVKTDSNGQIKLTGIVPTGGLEGTITAKITEIEVPTADGCFYKGLKNPITVTMTYDNATWTETGVGSISGNTLTVGIQNQPYINLEGMVWEDGQTGEKGNVSDANGQKDDNEQGLEGIEVYLCNGAGTILDYKNELTGNNKTNANGQYQFKDVPKTKEGYKVIFKYNGITYVETPNGTVSKPNEINRQVFNSNFKTISKDQSNNGATLIYNYNDTDKVSTLESTIAGHTTGTTDGTFQMSAQTAVYTNAATDINCGLVKKNFDLAIGTDVKEATLKINDKETKYTYAQIMNGELNADFQNSSSSVKDEDVIYNLYLYSSDYNYRIGDYKTDIAGNNVPDNDNNNIADYEDIKNLEAYVTYSVILKSQTTNAVTENSTVEQFVYYYDDSVYSPVFNVNDIVDGYKVESIEGNKITFESADSNNALSEDNDYRKEIKLTFKINKNAEGNLVVNETATNIAEITRYSTYEGGLIDKDSAPDNGITNGKITQYEDDTDEAKGLNIVLESQETRIITGTVFDDTYVDEAKTEYDKDGILNNNNAVVNDVIVQLIEIKKIGGKYYEYIWQETRSGSNTVKRLSEDGNTIEEITYRQTAPNDGSYVFTDFIPGNYIIRFIYGDGTTYNLTDNVKIYNGQDYKSTIDPNYNKSWYNTSNYSNGASVARDNEARRLEVMSYSTVINQSKAEELANTDSLINTWMCAETSRINIPVDADNTATDRNSTTASYNYTNTNTKVLFGDMNFGLALRPKTNIVLEKHITSLKITPSGTGVQPIVDAKALDIEKIVNGDQVEVQGVTTGLATIKSTAANRGFWQVATDVEELMQGAELEVEYTYVLRNDSEEDYLNKDVLTEYYNNIGKDVNTNGTDDYAEYLRGASDSVDTTIKNGTYSYSNNNRIGTYLGQFYYTGDKGANDSLVSSRVDSFEEALNNDLAFDESGSTSFKVTEQQINKPVYGVNKAEGAKETEIDTVVQNTKVSKFLTPKLENDHTTATADWSKTLKLKTTLATVSGGKLGANLPSYIAEILQYSNAAGRKDMKAIPANLGYVHSYDTTMTMANDNEQDEFWAESIIITKPTGEDKLTPLQIVIITISTTAILGVGIVLIKKIVLKK